MSHASGHLKGGAFVGLAGLLAVAVIVTALPPVIKIGECSAGDALFTSVFTLKAPKIEFRPGRNSLKSRSPEKAECEREAGESQLEIRVSDVPTRFDLLASSAGSLNECNRLN